MCLSALIRMKEANNKTIAMFLAASMLLWVP